MIFHEYNLFVMIFFQKIDITLTNWLNLSKFTAHYFEIKIKKHKDTKWFQNAFYLLF